MGIAYRWVAITEAVSVLRQAGGTLVRGRCIARRSAATALVLDGFLCVRRSWSWRLGNGAAVTETTVSTATRGNHPETPWD
jgi:hypothetical protein